MYVDGDWRLLRGWRGGGSSDIWDPEEPAPNVAQVVGTEPSVVYCIFSQSRIRRHFVAVKRAVIV